MGDLLKKYIASIGEYQFKRVHSDNSKKVVIYHGDYEDIDITTFAAKQIKNFGFTPIILGKYHENLAHYLKLEAGVEPDFVESRDKILEAIQDSKFGIFSVHESASADNFIALGFSIGLNKSFLPIKYANEVVPSDLSYLHPLEYVGFRNLEEKLRSQFPNWLATMEN